MKVMEGKKLKRSAREGKEGKEGDSYRNEPCDGVNECFLQSINGGAHVTDGIDDGVATHPTVIAGAAGAFWKSSWKEYSDPAREYDNPTLDGGSTADLEEQGPEEVGELGGFIGHDPALAHV
jgi:hypothetical protein